MKGTVRGKTVTFEHKGLKNELTARYTSTLDEQGTGMTESWHLSTAPNTDGIFRARKSSTSPSLEEDPQLVGLLHDPFAARMHSFTSFHRPNAIRRRIGTTTHTGI